MGTLSVLLRCLEREDVSEVRLQSETVAAAARGGSYAPLTKQVLSTPQIEQIVAGTVVLGAIRSGTQVRGRIDVGLGDHQYTVHVQRAEERVQLRFFRVGEGGDSLPRLQSADADSAAAPSTAGVVEAPPEPAAVAHGAASTVAKDLHGAQELGAMLKAARAQSASDLHIFAGQPARLRRNGDLLPMGQPLSAQRVEALLRSILSPRQEADLERQGYADLSLDLPQAGRLRVNIGTQASGFKGCFRLVTDTIPTLESLGLPKELADVANYHQGLAIISGPNGVGKTTTMAAIVNIINTHSPHHIITVEDPVEILHPVKSAIMTHREVGTHTKSFARALKAALREDPDVIVIGELRDRETVEIALSAAETGHLVIATMSTRSAAKTIDRLIDLFPPDLQSQVRATLAGALKIIVSQRLVPGVQGNSVPVAELITGSVPLWNLIRDNKLFQLPSLQQRGRGLGMIKFDTSLQELLVAGKITADVAKKNAENWPELERMMKQGSADQGAEGGGKAVPGNTFGKRKV